MLPAIRNKRDLSVALSKELPKYFSKPEIDLIFDSVKHSQKNYLLLSLLWQTGARVSEILQLKVKDIDFHSRSIRITTLKQKSRPQRDNMGTLPIYYLSFFLGRPTF
jgi:integrase